jgi:hypothetical protein
MFEAAFGMGLRFDERLDRNGTLGPDGRVRRVIDFTVLRSRTTTKRMSDGGQWKVVNDELKTAGLTNASKKYLVWVDAPQSDYCGMSTLPAGTARAASHPANGRTVSSINRYYDPADANGGFCSPVVHEMLHSMGAVQAAAPHYSAGHCNDGTNDILCAKLATYDPSLGFYIDYGNDDYWDPAADPDAGSTAKLGWWTVNLNRFLCPPAAPGARVADCAKANQPAY